MPSTINAYMRVLSTVMNRAHEGKKLAAVPKIEYLDEAELECKCLEDDEVDRLLAAARAMHPRFEQLLLFGFNSGGRKTETFALTWKEIDLFSNGVTKVNFKKTKFGRQRFVAIPDGLRDMLRQMKAAQEAGGYMGDRVFAYQHPKSGNWLVPRDMDSQMKALRKAAKVEDFTLHVCRHTYASRILRRGGRLEEVSKLLGHKDIMTTHRVYAHLDQNNVDAAVVKYLDRDWASAAAA
jgi:integrase